MHSEHWPLFDLVVRTPRAVLRYPDDPLLHELVEVAAAGVHAADEMPFAVPWTETPPPLLQRSTLQYWWGERAAWRPEHWHLPLVVMTDGRVRGVQSLMADDFAIVRTVSSGSWLGRAFQGAGLGTEMRAAALHLAFAGLGAERARSGAFVDNHASIAVSIRLGYEDDGAHECARRGQVATQRRFLLTRQRWEAHRRDDIVIEGLEACRSLLGAR